MTDDHEVTHLLSAWGRGDSEAFDRLTALVYDDLSRLASRALRGEREGHTLTTHALVHESYLNLVGKDVGEWENRGQFFALAAKVMRRILIDHARARRAQKRGGGQIHLTLGNRDGASPPDLDQLLDLDAALTSLAGRDARLGEVVECRFFGGMTVAETAEALGVSQRTVERDWTRAKAYLYRDLTAGTATTLF
ncbi:MAG: sigma-70 family RNA polymerase sigma factor [Gemmatimonadota bacterium]|nr:sigma-70 family RNA polymerase sigma factor [Gemmatimonadota bacterium]